MILRAGLAGVVAASLLAAWIPNGWPVETIRTVIFGMGVVLLAVDLFTGRRPELHPWLLGPALVAAAGALQLAFGWSVYPWATADATLGWLANTVLLFLALQGFSDRQTRNLWLRRFLYFGFVLCIFSVIQLYTAGGKVLWHFESPRVFVMGTLGYKNHFAALVELLFPIALWRATRSSRRVNWHLGIAAFLAASTVAAASRSGAVVVALEFVACTLILWRRKILPTRTVLRVAILFVVFAAAAVGVLGWQQFQNKLGEQGDTRLLIYRSSLEMTGERPWTGFGLGTWTTVYPAYAHYDRGLFVNAAHDDWLQWAGEGGVITALVLLLLALSTIRPAAASVWAVGIPAVFLHAAIDFPFQLPALNVVIFMLLGVLAKTPNRSMS